MRAIGLLALFASIPFAAADTAKAKPPDPKPDAKTFLDHATLGQPIQVESLALVPIVGDGTKAEQDLLVLDEAMAEKLVRVTEFDEGNVNSLNLQNRADKPVFLLAGEVIIGGKQDRIIGRNTIIPAKTTQQVPVYCVEHGRWDNKTKEFTTAKALAHGRLRAQASYGGQQEVWNEVSAKNELRATKSSTDTYRKVASQQADGTNGKWEKRVDDAIAKLDDKTRDQMVGFAVALNGKVATIDVFESPKLFKKLQRKLVRSYVTEAVDVKAQKDAKAPTLVEVKTFVADAEKAKAEPSYDTAYAATVQKKGRSVGKSGVSYKHAAKAAPAGSKPGEAKPASSGDAEDAEAKPVYLNYQSHQ
jgi:hypothetical protein